MTTYTHVTAPTQFVEAHGIRYAYRRFGAELGVPLLFLQHFRGGMDHWDPAVTDGFGKDRPVILFDNAGVASSGGETPSTVAAMGAHVATFVEALGLTHLDVLGFSLGGMVAQEFALLRPQWVRRLILVGTAPRGGESLGQLSPEAVRAATSPVSTLEHFLTLFFEQSETSQAAGKAFWKRRHERTAGLEPATSVQTMNAQLAATSEWAEVKGSRYADLARIEQPVLVVNGRNDVMVPTVNSYLLQQHLPNAQLILYPDSGHAAHFQYPELFVTHASRFLNT
ncbi:alpha/beta fold hydrolase [Stigmatella aurantiaca]|uniref:Hydrolase, alpha/beta fold family n=1 Tax=Stigmatella aurantiaca (strain DW4/3-1) TaxID=378806 RepID=Q09DY6_STIAD|nr:alpha/beta hydrolase [Stigmatella aurantiaca]ADO75175.1 hydrolase, alpha/beta fold family [Stigmatella aurantiaca DW4/3-1]EAU69845.1 hydrolase, alpha/beta hydrolase fold family [Stigmatella aurantiaca DW4/3-1]